MICLIAYYKDINQQIIKLRLLPFILRISDAKFPPDIRSNAVFAISLLTDNDALFDEIINKGVIDLIMNLCKDKN